MGLLTALIQRRTFLQAAAGLPVVTRSLFAQDRPAPSDRIHVGIIGLGARGFNLLHEFLREPDCQIVALCDVDRLHYRDNPWGKGKAYGCEPGQQAVTSHYDRESKGTTAPVAVYTDFRKLLDHSDLDAVVIATPDHWHALVTISALRAGLDVYCEKPVAHLFIEGQLVYHAVAERQAIFQTGSQQRSDARFRRAVELVQNGHLGRIRHIEVGLPPGYDKPQGDTTVTQPPKHHDYDLWCGPAPALPYMRARHHRWWRGHRAFGGGVLMDWIGHHNDIAHWAMGVDRSGPISVEAVGWRFPETNVYDSPMHYEIRCAYAGGWTSSISDRHELGTKWIGDDGWLFVTRSKMTASNAEWLKDTFDPGPKRVYDSPGHVRNFLDCVRSRKKCVAPAETAHRSITPGHLAYVSDALKRPLKWDPRNERIVGDSEADKLLRSLKYREPWTLG